MERPLHDLADGADLGDAPGIHHGHPVGRLRDHAHVMCDEHHGRAALRAQPLDQHDDLGLNRNVERRRRLVGDDEFRLRTKGQRQHDPLPHAAGELVGVAINAPFGCWDADFLEQIDGSSPSLGLGQGQVGQDGLDDLVPTL